MKNYSITFVILLFVFFLLVKGNSGQNFYDKRYNQVTYAAAHNAQSCKKSVVQNQDKSITEQLNAGIRAFKIPLWYDIDVSGRLYICACHGLSKSLLLDLHDDQILANVPYLARPIVKKVLQYVRPLLPTVKDALCAAYGQYDSDLGIIPFNHKAYDPAAVPLVSLCNEICSFVACNKSAIVTLILEDFTNNYGLIASSIRESGLLRYVHTQSIDQPWPTLNKMIKSGQRVVILVRSDSGTQNLDYPWLHNLWDYAWDTRFSFSRERDFNNDVVPNRGKKAFEKRNSPPCNKLFIMYHFITPVAGGSAWWARKVNRYPCIKRRCDRLYRQTGCMPNFIQVDFFEYPNNDIFRVVNDINRFSVWQPSKIVR